MTLYVLFVNGEIYETHESEWTLRDTASKLEPGQDWRVVRFESSGTVAQSESPAREEP
jgi:hypothetical protein